MTFELVVAHYDEDLSWLRRVSADFKITVYSKNESPILPCFHSPILLPNLGHEAHTYLHHMVNRYDDLADVTVFAQGKPFDHVPDFRKTLHKMVDGNVVVADFLWLGFIIDREDQEGTLFKKWHPDKELPIARFWHHLFENDMPEHLVFYPGAHFAVSADQIRSRDVAFYKRALELSTEGMEIAHCFERCWETVFGIEETGVEYDNSDFPVYLRPIQRLGITWDDVPEQLRPWNT